jgi:hypothetical protein
MIAGFLGWLGFYSFSKNKMQSLAVVSALAGPLVYCIVFKHPGDILPTSGLAAYSFVSGISLLYLVFKALGVDGSLKE